MVHRRDYFPFEMSSCQYEYASVKYFVSFLSIKISENIVQSIARKVPARLVFLHDNSPRDR